MPNYNRDPKRDHNFDNHPHGCFSGLGVRDQDLRLCRGVVSDSTRLAALPVDYNVEAHDLLSLC